jgi:tetraacyldisaccharide 4'-kinase
MIPTDRKPIWFPVLIPLSWIYGGGVAAMRALRTAPAPPTQPPFIVAVGNLEVGGSGKTPLALWLIERAARAGKRAAYVSRGFASDAERGPLVTVVPHEDAPPPANFAGLRVVARHSPDLAAAVGDEGALIARRAHHTPLFLSRDKRRAVEAAARAGAEIIVVDDAFQSFALGRHVNVLLLDARRPFDNGWVLPAGRLRENPAAIARADVIVFNGAGRTELIEEARGRVAKWLRPEQRVYGLRREITLVPVTAAAKDTPSSVTMVAGIAKWRDFGAMLEGAGMRVIDARRFRDHHSYTEADARTLRAGSPDQPIVTTEKDWVKLGRFEWGERAVWVARLDVELVGREPVDSWLLG